MKFSIGNVDVELKKGGRRPEESRKGEDFMGSHDGKASAGDAAGLNKEAARLVRFES